MDRRDRDLFGDRVEARLDELAVPITIEAVDFFERRPNGSIMRRSRLGRVINDLIDRPLEGEYVCIVAPNERLFSDHLCSLVGTLERCEEAGAAWCDMLFQHTTEGKDFADLSDGPNFREWCSNKPIGLGRFLFRASAFGPKLCTALPYTDVLAVQLLAGTIQLAATKRCTLINDIQSPFNTRCSEARPDEEREILVDYAPGVFEKERTISGPAEQIETQAFPLERMGPAEKERFAVELAHTIPLPAIVKKIGFGLYRLWYRTTK
jgi:hypothetical protein